LDTHRRTIVNKFEFGDSSKTLNGKGEFKFTTIEGAGIFSWTYKYLKGIPSKVTHHRIELDTTIPPTHQARYKLCNNNQVGY
jgi:hypothetical protein